MIANAGRLAVIACGALLLGLGACTDPEAVAKAEAEAKAQAAKAKEQDQLKRRMVHQVECLNALRWQKAALASTNIGKVDLYVEHFQGELDKGLAGGDAFPGQPPQPMLSRATLQDYLAWSYPDDVANKFTAGTDADKDGTVSSKERTNRGFAIVSACVQEVADLGKGPLAARDRVDRMYHMEIVRSLLEDKGA